MRKTYNTPKIKGDIKFEKMNDAATYYGRELKRRAGIRLMKALGSSNLPK